MKALLLATTMMGIGGCGDDAKVALQPDGTTDGAMADADLARCWDPTAIDHDEDGDSIMDGCDNCPQHANGDQLNPDGDGLGDACDPRPMQPDAIAAFYGFNAAAELDAFERVNPWAIVDGALVQSNPSGAHGARAVLYPSFVHGTASVVAVGLSEPATAQTPNASFGVSVSTDLFGSAALACHVTRRFGQTDTLSFVRAASSITTVPADLPEPVGIRVTSSDPTGQARCDANGEQVLIPDMLGPHEGRVAVYTSGSTARVTSLLVSVPE